jgi:polysaccharide biosynthesis protein PelG
VMVETEFYADYRSYIDHLETSPLKMVDERRESLWRNLKRRMNNLFELEVVIAVLGFFIGTFVLRRLGLNEEAVRIFQVLIGAAFCQVLFWIHLILLLYFEFRVRALAMTVLFAALNLGLTAAQVRWLPDLGYGWGYFAAIGASTVVSWLALRHGLRNLNRHIFFINSAVPAGR